MCERVLNCCVILLLVFLNLGCSDKSSATNADSGQDSGEGNSAFSDDGSADNGTDADAMDGTDGRVESGGANDHGVMDGGTDELVDGAATGETEATQTLMSGVHEWVVSQEIDGQAVERRVLIHGPKKNQESSSYPVVFAFHGNGGKAGSWAGRLGPILDKEGFIGVYPEGYLKSWNLGQEKSTADDLVFVDMIVEHLKTIKQANVERMFAIGNSNGAGMSNYLAVHRGYFRAIGVASSVIAVGNEPTSQTAPVAVIQIHGMKDKTCPYDGGLAPMGHVFYGAEEAAAIWAENNGCESAPTQSESGQGNLLLTWNNCEEGRTVRHYGIKEAGHGFSPQTEGGVDQLRWNFFKSLP